MKSLAQHINEAQEDSKYYVYSRLSDTYNADEMHLFGTFDTEEKAIAAVTGKKGKILINQYFDDEYREKEVNKPNGPHYFEYYCPSSRSEIAFLITKKKYTDNERWTKRKFGYIGWEE